MISRLAIALVALTLLLSAAPKNITIEDALAVRAPSEPKFSPDGKWIVYSQSSWNKGKNRRQSHLYLVPAEGGESIKLTNGEKGESAHQWSPAGSSIAFLADRDSDGSKGNQVWIIRPTGGEAEKITSEENAIIAFTWSPDGKQIAFVTKDAPRDKTERDKRNKDKFDAIVVESEYQYAHLWTIDVSDKKKKRITDGQFSVRTPMWSPDGKWIAYAASESGASESPYANISLDNLTDIYIVSPEDRTPRRLTENPGLDSSPRWSPDSKQIAFLSRTDAKSWAAKVDVHVVSLDGGAPRNLTGAFAESATELGWSSSDIVFASADGVNVQLYRTSAAGSAPTPVTQGTKSHAQFDLNGKRLVYVVTGRRAAADIFTGEGRRLTNANPQLEEITIAESEVIHWKGPDNLDIEGVLTKPVDYEPGKRYPMIVQIHGGPYSRFDGGYNPRVQVFAAKGYAVLQPNPRGSVGYGNQFTLANVGDWGGKDFADIMAGVDAAIAKGIADPEKLAVMGGSYGGFMTFWTITQTNRFKAAIGHAGISDWYSFHGQSDIPGLMEFGMKGYPWTSDAYRKFSPMTYADRVKTPILITHGEQDRRVPIAQSEEYYRALKARGVDVQFVRYPREGHGITEPNHQIDLTQRQMDWFDQRLGISR
jgi:dipeptidyl aminopeptidase/acylaminoacyl peptidase